ncbi:hypothetical protein B0A52_06064 [Exophiala mesophila]|uniref:CSC1/OSCA1-like 7TM region domain-containing protein n=1 Tax=Exophiala mesophila TaxID=212818 RepID=A0A438N594_EXOME|nr:hypothetical protein B0A52_06064 [Exophiala mesophila]
MDITKDKASKSQKKLPQELVGIEERGLPLLLPSAPPLFPPLSQQPLSSLPLSCYGRNIETSMHQEHTSAQYPKVNATAGGDASELDKISFSNVNDPKKLYAHAIVAWIFLGFIMLLITRERMFVIGLRQAYQATPQNASRLSSRVVLFLSVPPDWLKPEHLQRHFGPDAIRSWNVSSLEDVEQIVATRDAKVDQLEQAELKFLKKRHRKHSADTGGRSSDEATEDRPQHRSYVVVGQKSDTIALLRQELPEIASDLAQRRRADKSSPSHGYGTMFVEFKDQVSANQAFQQFHHPAPFALQPKFIGVQPKEVLWQNLNLEPAVRVSYSYIAIAVAVATIILWSIPVGIIGTISNLNYLTDKVRFLRFLNDLPDPILGLITGLVPPLLLSTVVSYVPYYFKWLATISGQPTTKEVVKWAQTWNFVFQVVQVFLITTFSSGAATVATKIANDPKSIPTLLAKNLPKASNFYLTYFIIQGIGTASKNIINYSDLLQFLFYYNVMSKTPRQKYNTYIQIKGISWFNVFPKFTNFAVIAIAYSCIAPLVLGFAAVGIYLFYLSYRYNLLYVIQVKSETRGESYTRALQHLMVGVYLSELCLIGLFGIKKASGASTLLVILFLTTIVYHLTINRYLGPLEMYLPVDALNNVDEESRLLDSNGGANPSEDSRIYRLGRGKVPTVLLDPLASFLEPHVFASQEALRPWLQDPEGEYEETVSYTEEQLENAYLNPALTSKTPKIWLPKDSNGLSNKEVEENEKAGLPCTNDGATLDYESKIRWNTEDFSTVPIFKEATKF